MFVGEAPGRDEDEQGLAFVGRAGQLLTKIIEAMGFQRDDVFIANVLKCVRYNARVQLGDGSWERIGSPRSHAIQRNSHVGRSRGKACCSAGHRLARDTAPGKARLPSVLPPRQEGGGRSGRNRADRGPSGLDRQGLRSCPGARSWGAHRDRSGPESAWPATSSGERSSATAISALEVPISRSPIRLIKPSTPFSRPCFSKSFDPKRAACESPPSWEAKSGTGSFRYAPGRIELSGSYAPSSTRRESAFRLPFEDNSTTECWPSGSWTTDTRESDRLANPCPRSPPAGSTPRADRSFWRSSSESDCPPDLLTAGCFSTCRRHAAYRNASPRSYLR